MDALLSILGVIVWGLICFYAYLWTNERWPNNVDED